MTTTESPVIPRYNPDAIKAHNPGKGYFFLGLLSNALVWGAAITYLQVTEPTYTSEWAISLPGIDATTSVEVPGIGRADSQSESPYRHDNHDPRENYKFIAESDEVITSAASQVELPKEDFGEPRIKIVDNTTLMRFEIRGDSPQQAQEKAIAFQDAFQTKLEQLRLQEIEQQDSGLKDLLKESQQNLLSAQKRLSEYKASSGLSSSEQLRDLSINIEELRRLRAETLAQLQQVSGRFQQLSQDLELSTTQANDSFVLKSDPLFQQHLADYNRASTELATLQSKFLPLNPTVIAKQREKDTAETALLRRSAALLGQPVSGSTLELPDIANSGEASARDTLSQELISLQSQQQGLALQAQELTRQIEQLESRLKLQAQQESGLENLRRDVQIAEAVFTSTLTKLDLSKSKIASSYPQTQLLIQPSLPDEPTAPKVKYVWLGTAMCSFFLTTGMISLWWRSHQIHKQQQQKPQPSEIVNLPVLKR
ncbi:MAG: hypothetical protein SAL07_17150 [Oscillatoria sp. PMC 1051.18]|nr:hypothetical protein [Oscillatoria sp. PMC 1050.18]MEC5031629.1 hypothetical protein [Oscillatoria sp. PMC 1051.18]